MDINVRLEEEKDYRRVEEIIRAAFGYSDRIKRGQIGCPYEHWMVHELRRRDGIMALSLVAELEGTILFFGRPEYYPQFGFKQGVFYGISDSEGYNYPAFMAMELKEGYLKDFRGGKYFESDIYNDELNRETVRAFDKAFILDK